MMWYLWRVSQLLPAWGIRCRVIKGCKSPWQVVGLCKTRLTMQQVSKHLGLNQSLNKNLWNPQTKKIHLTIQIIVLPALWFFKDVAWVQIFSSVCTLCGTYYCVFTERDDWKLVVPGFEGNCHKIP
jgi:hypothetical protein